MLRLTTALLLLSVLSCKTEDDTPDETETDLVDTPDTEETEQPRDTDPPSLWPESSTDYEVEAATYIHRWTLPEADACCFDFGDISSNDPGEIDNSLIILVEALGPVLGVDIQQLVDDGVQAGSLALLLDHRGLPSTGDGTYDLSMLTVAFDESAATTWAEASAGQGSFVTLQESFVPGTGEPSHVFERVSKTGDKLVASGGTSNISLPFGTITLRLPLTDVRLDATLAPSDDGVVATDGTLSGMVAVDALFGSLNDAVARDCGCLGVTGDFFSKDSGRWVGQCVVDDTLCADPEDDLCRTVGLDAPLDNGACAFFPGILEASADLNTDPQAGNENISVGLEWAGTTATVTGVAP